MKRLLAIAALSITLTACGGGNNDSSNSNNMQGNPVPAGDSIKRASDSVTQTGDTSAMNGTMGDSSSSSSSHGEGSGSRVGGGKTDGPQEKKGQ
jgi:hypothetical protein